MPALTSLLQLKIFPMLNDITIKQKYRSSINPASIYLFKVKTAKTGQCVKLKTIKTPKQCHESMVWSKSRVRLP